MPPNNFRKKLTRYYFWYTLVFIIFLLSLAVLEKEGVPRTWIGYLFMFATILLYAGIGVLSRTSDLSEYYVAGRRVPGIFNGMATAADWMSAASFLSLAGGLYLQGFDGFAYIVGWTGGFCLVALLIAPYLRKFAQYSIPDFLNARYGGIAADGSNEGSHFVRALAVIATIIISFTYVVAQIYGVGLITSRFTGIDFSMGVFLGLASILVCSFLGGMRAVTWTQVAQYIIIIIAYLIPVTWLSVKHTQLPVPQIAYGTVIPKLESLEKKFSLDPQEQQVRAIFKQRSEFFQGKIAALPQSWTDARFELQQKLDDLKSSNASLIEIKTVNKELANFPTSPEEAQRRWSDLKNMNLQRSELSSSNYTPYAGKDQAESNIKRNNFLALVFCLMLGTAALPHILIRYYTTPSVRESRESVFWSLFFIMLLYISIPALAILVKYDIYTSLVGIEFSKMPSWVSYWASIDKTNPLVNIFDINRDGIVQLAEIALDPDIVVLATPEIAGLPYVISGLLAAGGLAAALSTADGLLLTISNCLSHDIYFKMINPQASSQKRVTISKLLLLVVALLAAYAASFKPADILSLVGVAFSLAASTLFPVLVLGIFWKRANQAGAIAGMSLGFLVCVYYLIRTHSFFGGNIDAQWWHIAPISAGIFGVPCGFIALVVVSLLTSVPNQPTQEFVDYIREP